MKIIVGLGNPGSKYEGTRHNVGFEVGFELSRRWQADRPRQKFDAEIAEASFNGEKILLVWPQTYMNLSGQCVGPLLKFYHARNDELLVLCDDLDIKLGQLRLRGSGSAGGQRGLQHILQVLGTNIVARLRVGVDRPAPGQDAAQYVLAKFRKEELDAVDESIRRAAGGVERWVASGLSAAMNEVNTNPKERSERLPSAPEQRPILPPDPQRSAE